MRIGLKLLLLITITSLALAVGIGSVFFTLGQRAMTEKAYNHLESVNVLKEAQMNGVIGHALLQLKAIADEQLVLDTFSVPLKHHLDSEEGMDLHVQGENLLKERQISHEHFVELFILDLDGVVHSSSNEAQVGTVKSDRQYFIEGKEGACVSEIYARPVLQQPTLVMAVPVLSSDGTLWGVLVARVNLVNLGSIISESSGLGESGETYLVNSFSEIVGRSRFISNSESGTAVHSRGIDDCLNGNNGYGFYEDYRGVPILGVYNWLPEVKLCLLAEMDQAEVLAPLNMMKIIVTVISTLMTLAIITLAFAFSRSITKPIVELVKATEEFAKGNFGYQVDIRSNDELAVLASMFNKVSNELKKAKRKEKRYHENLQEQVEAKTKELNQKVDELEEFTKLSVGRELKMVELKKEIKGLKEEIAGLKKQLKLK